MPVHTHAPRIGRTVAEPPIHRLGGRRDWIGQDEQGCEEPAQSCKRTEGRFPAGASASDHWCPIFNARMTWTRKRQSPWTANSACPRALQPQDYIRLSSRGPERPQCRGVATAQQGSAHRRPGGGAGDDGIFQDLVNEAISASTSF